jgi:FlaA1/EpsC-like NDP-sugar epimerase
VMPVRDGRRQGETEGERHLNYPKCMPCLVLDSNNTIFVVKESDLVGILVVCVCVVYRIIWRYFSFSRLVVILRSCNIW